MPNFNSAAEVLLAAPQWIGYLRAFLYTAGFAIIDVPAVHLGITVAGWHLSLLCYTTAFVLDVVDGMVARALDQTSQLGGVLDMVIDRAATAALLTTLAGAYHEHRLWFAALVALDVGSHWVHCASAQLTQSHHKAAKTLERRNILLRLYYGVYPFFGYCCVGTELFYILLLALSYAPTAALSVAGFQLTLYAFTWTLCFPACLLKNVVNLMQLGSAMKAIADFDVSNCKGKKK